MASVINTNVLSLNSQRNLSKSQGELATSLQRLSSGLRINSAKDDAAGLAISDRMTSQIRGLNQAGRNANDGISLSQTAEGALSQTGDLLQRMRELSIQSANGTNSATDRAALQAEVKQLIDEVDRVSETTEFNGLKLLDGSFTSQAFQVGANANQTIDISIAGAGANDLASYTIDAESITTASKGTSASVAGADVSANNAIAGEALTIAGVANKDITIAANLSTKEIAALINAESDTTGVTAEATTVAELASFTDGTSTMTINGKSVGAAVTSSDVSSLVTEINKVTSETGVTATSESGKLILTAKDGRDIDLLDYSSTNGTKTVSLTVGGDHPQVLTAGATDSSTITGTIKMTSSESFSVVSDTTEANGSILESGTTSKVADINTLSSVDISSAEGSQNAISIIDAALSSINGFRAELGATQNRFDAVITNLQTTSENLNAARSRIRDADFAEETANLTRSQILQQAGTAMLAQANQIPQGVLSLLG